MSSSAACPQMSRFSVFCAAAFAVVAAALPAQHARAAGGSVKNAEDLLIVDCLLPGQVPNVILLGDKGFSGRDFEHQADELGITFVRPDRRDETRRHGNLAGIRQRIESIIDTLKGDLSLERHGGRTPAGVYTRVAQRLLALAATIWHNWATDAPTRRSVIAYDH